MPTPKKSLGQHWLFDEDSLDSICDAADIMPTDTVFEIGPGLGPLTVRLTAQAQKVIAIELDEQLARELPARVPAHNLQVVHSDVLQYDLTALPKGYKVVANVPYYVTSLIVRALLTSVNPPAVAVLLVQKEVAERLAAKPGDMSVLGISAQFYADVILGKVVTADKFKPAPKVDSQVVILKIRQTPLFTDVDTKLFFRVVKAGFSEKRKTLRNSLSGGLGISKDQTEELLKKADISPAVRAETLFLEQWYALAKVYSMISA